MSNSASLTPLGKINQLITEFKEANHDNPMLEPYLEAFDQNWDDKEDIINHLKITQALAQLMEKILPICN